MEKKDKVQKPLYKKWWFWLIVLCVLGAAGNGLSGNSPTPAENTPSASVSSPPAESTPLEKQPEDSSTPSVPVESTPSATPSSTGNILLDSELIVQDVMNGTGTEVIGQSAHVKISSEQLKNLTSDSLVEFAETRVKDSGYNWVSIVADGRDGIIFPGSDIVAPIYGKLSEKIKDLEESIGFLLLSDGVYTYSAG